jgi:TIR domain
MRNGGVFINHRGEDSGAYGVLLHFVLSRYLGPEAVFLDSESLVAGSDYVDELLTRVHRCRVLLAVIGPHWLTATDQAGRRRIDNPHDWIRRELVEAFAAGVAVVPIVTDGAEMPVEDELPNDIAMLGRRQYRRLRHRDASADLARLIVDLAVLDNASGGPRGDGWARLAPAWRQRARGHS